MSQFILSSQIHKTVHMDSIYTFFLEDFFSLKKKKNCVLSPHFKFQNNNVK